MNNQNKKRYYDPLAVVLTSDLGNFQAWIKARICKENVLKNNG